MGPWESVPAKPGVAGLGVLLPGAAGSPHAADSGRYTVSLTSAGAPAARRPRRANQARSQDFLRLISEQQALLGARPSGGAAGGVRAGPRKFLIIRKNSA